MPTFQFEWRPMIEEPWTTMHPLRLGSVPTGLGTADDFLKISKDGHPFLRVDLYSNGSEHVFDSELVWHGHIFVGYGDTIFVIDPELKVASTIPLEWYFGHFYSGDDYLLAACAQQLLRFAENGEILWKSPELGIDGVVVNSVANGLIKGEGEWDPPGGWKPFVLYFDSGKLLVEN
jgi:hypothetical protein